MSEVCPNFEKCPIYNDILKDKETTANAYKKQYCEANKESWMRCKRYQVKEKYGKCPPNLLPNSSLSIEEIAKRYFN